MGATIRFDEMPGEPGRTGGIVGASVALEGATLSAGSGADIFIYRTGDFGFPDGGGFCAVVTGFFCKGNATLTFALPVTGLTLGAFYVGPLDRAVVAAFAGDALLRAVDVSGDGLIDFRGLQGVTRISFTDVSDPLGTGIAYGNLQYTLQPPPPPPPPPPPDLAPVPLPASGVMMLVALGLLAGRAYRTNGTRAGTAFPRGAA